MLTLQSSGAKRLNWRSLLSVTRPFTPTFTLWRWWTFLARTHGQSISTRASSSGSLKSQRSLLTKIKSMWWSTGMASVSLGLGLIQRGLSRIHQVRRRWSTHWSLQTISRSIKIISSNLSLLGKIRSSISFNSMTNKTQRQEWRLHMTISTRLRSTTLP